jgi:hypothetical protein
MTIFIELLRALDASMGVQGGNILSFVNSCSSHPQCISILRNVKFVHFLPNCTTLLQNLDLGITKYFQQLYRKHMVQKTACMLDSGKDVPTEIKHSASNTCHSHALATYEPNTEDYGDSHTEDDEAFRYE